MSIAEPKTYRIMFKFWLDVVKPDENELAEQVEQLKQERAFSRAIRQGLRLWISLKNRDTRVLLELFPWIAEALREPQTGGNDVSPYAIESGANALLERGETGYMLADLVAAKVAEKLAGQQPRSLPAPRPNRTMTEPPLADLITISNAQSDGGKTGTANFLASMAALQQSTATKGNSKPAKNRPKPLTLEGQEQTTGSPKKLAGADLAFKPPALDDLPEIGF